MSSYRISNAPAASQVTSLSRQTSLTPGLNQLGSNPQRRISPTPLQPLTSQRTQPARLVRANSERSEDIQRPDTFSPEELKARAIELMETTYISNPDFDRFKVLVDSGAGEGMLDEVFLQAVETLCDTYHIDRDKAQKGHWSIYFGCTHHPDANRVASLQIQYLLRNHEIDVNAEIRFRSALGTLLDFTDLKPGRHSCELPLIHQLLEKGARTDNLHGIPMDRLFSEYLAPSRAPAHVRAMFDFYSEKNNPKEENAVSLP